MTFTSQYPVVGRCRRPWDGRWRAAALVLITVLLAGCGGGVVVDSKVVPPRAAYETRQLRDRLVEMTVPSSALGTSTVIRVLLPVGWTPDDRARWPVLYLLHGCCDGDQGHTRWSDSVDLKTVDEFQDVLVVMPDGGSLGFYSDWLNGPKWETHHLRELPKLMAQRFGATDRRVIAGNSMGGFGALSYAARHPGMFAAAASFSGVSHPLLPEDGPALMRSLADGEGRRLDDLWGDPATHRPTWAQHNPYDLAERLVGIPVYLSCGDGQPGPLDPPESDGDGEEGRLGRQNAALAQRLGELSADRAVINLYGPGTHTWAYWDRELRAAAPILRTALG